MKNLSVKIFAVLAILFLSWNAQAQIVDPVKWKFGVVYLENGEAEITATAKIDPKWHVYALKVSEDPNAIGPIPTTLNLTADNSKYTKVGGVIEGKYITHFDPNFEMNLNYFENTASFKQRVKIISETPFQLNGVVEYMACDETKCIFPDPVKFKLQVTPNAADGSAVSTTPADTSALVEDQMQLEPTTTKFRYWIQTIRNDKEKLTTRLESGSVSASNTQDGNMWQLFFLGFLGGLVALLTPCVFPMIPLTVAFFTKGNKDRKKGIFQALIYGGFIFLIYILLSMPFHFLDQINENILNDISTNVPLNIVFFVIFIVFALSFFGLFEITLPAGLANKMDKNAEAGGMLGAFFMALTLAIVSFSCTGPILGSLLAGSLAKDGGAIQLTVGMGGFGLALGIPFALFAMFPGMMKSLPKSGGWLNSVKVVLGFLEVALALKFLSQADLVVHWNLLKYEVFMGLWVVIFFGMYLYLIGAIKFSHDSPIQKFSKFRIVFTTFVGMWVVYLASGLMLNEKGTSYNALSLMSGLAPPTGYSYAYPSDCPHGLLCEHDYNVALERARKEGKPLFVDFTGYACVNCRKMEEHVWPQVLDLLQNEFIVVSLYVDDKQELPAELKETVVTKWAGIEKEIETYGDLWSAFEIETFNNNSQPMYAIIDPMTEGREELMNPIKSGIVETSEFRAWLEEGLQAFNNK
ncbi:MAG: protein-disulfide reductase DsbD family protein [Flavobacteriales bacterium]|jgi:thiol:disulfide interchange protein DsbD